MTGRGKVKSQRISIAKRAGTIFPVSRIRRYLKGCTHHQRVAVGAPIYQAAVMEYLSAEILELAGNAANDNKKRRITPRHILLAIANDEELNKLLKNVTIPSGGVMPHILPELLTKRKDISKGSLSKATKKSMIPKVQNLSIQKAKNKVVTPTKNVIKKHVLAKTAPGKGIKPVKVEPALKLSPIKLPSKVPRKIEQIQTLSEKMLFLGQKLTVVKGDISSVACDAVVHPTNGNFNTSGQVGAALIKLGGDELIKSINELHKSHGNLAYAGALIGDGLGLKSKHIVHVHSPTWGKDSSIKDLETAVKNALTLVDEKNLSSIAFPSIGSGTNNFPKQTAAQTIFKSISNYFVTVMASSIKHIYFVLYDMESIGVYTTELARLE